MNEKIAFRLLIIATLCLTFLIYWPGLSGGFFFDDEPNITHNDFVAIHSLDAVSLKRAAFSASTGLFKRPISVLSFALNYYGSGGFNPYSFKLTNVAIHALNGVAVFALTWLLLLAHRRVNNATLSDRHLQWLTLAITAVWLVHPLNLTSVLYVVQRMTSLSAFFTLLGLISYVLGRLRQQDGRAGMHLIITGLLGGGLLSILCKENGALLPVYMFAIEVSLFRFRARAMTAKMLVAFFIITIALPAGAFLGYFLSHYDWLLRVYTARNFTVFERLLTETRILWLYLRLIIAPDISIMGLYHDDIAVSHGLTAPITTLYAAFGLGGMIAGAIYCRRRAPLVTLGIVWFLAGQSMESTIIPLELAHEHRNYLPMYGILVPCIFYLSQFRVLPAAGRVRYILVPVVIVLFSAITMLRAMQYGDRFGQGLYEVRHHPDSARSNYEAGRSLVEVMDIDKITDHSASYAQALDYFQRSADLDKDSAAALFAMVYVSSKEHHSIDPAWMDSIRARLATARFTSVNINSLATFQKQLGNGSVALPQREVVSIFLAALKNPGLIGESKGMVFAMLGSYYQRRVHDDIAALNYMYQATQAAPKQAIFNLLFARQLIATGNVRGAREQLSYAARNDTLGILNGEINSLTDDLMKVKG